MGGDPSGPKRKFDVSEKYLTFFGRLAWPLTAGILLFLFYSPVYSFVERISAQEAQRVSLGSFNVEFYGDEAAKIPQLEAQVGKKLASLDADEREALLSVGKLTPLRDMCTVDGFERAIVQESTDAAEFVARRLEELQSRRVLLSSLEKLETKNLVRSRRTPVRESDFFCTPGNGRTYQLTEEDGVPARQYYLDLTARTINFAASDEASE